MAKRRKKTGKRRRVGAIGGNKTVNLIRLAALAGGFFMGDSINEMVDKINPIKKTNPDGTKVPNGTAATVGEIGIGGALLLMRKPSGTLGYLVKAGGGLVAGAGLRRAAKQLGVIKGYQSVPVIGKYRNVSGYQSTPVIAGAMPAQLSGIPGQLQGFRVNGYDSQGSGVMGTVIDPNGNGSGINTNSGYMQ